MVASALLEERNIHERHVPRIEWISVLKIVVELQKRLAITIGDPAYRNCRLNSRYLSIRINLEYRVVSILILNSFRYVASFVIFR